MKDSDFVIFHYRDGWIIKRVDCPYDFHSHLKTKSACVLVKRSIINKIMPKQTFFKESVCRMLTDDEKKEMRVNHKDCYYNRTAKQFNRHTG